MEALRTSTINLDAGAGAGDAAGRFLARLDRAQTRFTDEVADAGRLLTHEDVALQEAAVRHVRAVMRRWADGDAEVRLLVTAAEADIRAALAASGEVEALGSDDVLAANTWSRELRSTQGVTRADQFDIQLRELLDWLWTVETQAADEFVKAAADSAALWRELAGIEESETSRDVDFFEMTQCAVERSSSDLISRAGPQPDGNGTDLLPAVVVAACGQHERDLDGLLDQLGVALGPLRSDGSDNGEFASTGSLPGADLLEAAPPTVDPFELFWGLRTSRDAEHRWLSTLVRHSVVTSIMFVVVMTASLAVIG
jgi:hypothetical protein